jgi:hypothetical protein
VPATSSAAGVQDVVSWSFDVAACVGMFAMFASPRKEES